MFDSITRLYSIKVKDAETGATLNFTAADWSGDDKRLAVTEKRLAMAIISRLTAQRQRKLSFAAARQKLGVTGLSQSLDRCKDGVAHSLFIDLVVSSHQFESLALAQWILLAADWQQHGWLDLDRPKAPADGASVPDLGAAESGRRETAVAEMFGSRVDGAMLIAAGAVDGGLEPEGGYLSERREGQRVEHPARLEPADSQ